MTSLRTAASRLDVQATGLLPVPAILVLVYGFLIHLVHLLTMCTLYFPFAQEFWSLPLALNLSLVELLTAINLLIALYLVVSFWAFVSRKSNRSVRGLIHWGAYIASLVVLIAIHLYVHRTGEEFGLPDEILELRTTEFHELRPRGLEDLVLPKSDLCRGFRKPFEERFTVNISRKGHLIMNRRDLGPVGAVKDRIQSLLSSKVEKTARNPDGTSELIVLVRADTEALFEHVRDVLEICSGKEIKIYRIELGCMCDLKRRAPEAYEKLKFPYWLPEGKVNAYLPRNAATEGAGSGKRPVTIRVVIQADEESEEGFLIEVHADEIKKPGMSEDLKMLGGPGMLGDLHETLRSNRRTAPGFQVVICPGEGIRHGQVIKVLSECLRAEAAGISFGGATPR